MNAVPLSRALDSPSPTSIGARAKILIVDDEEMARALVTTVLDVSGYDIASVASADEALSHLAEHPVDLVILDLMLPQIDGLEACRRIRARFGRSMAVLMMSARGRGAVVQTLEAGADDFLAKPFDVDELEARVNALLRSRMLEMSAVRWSERLLALQRITAAIVARRDEAAIVNLVLQEARRLLGASGVALCLWDPLSELLRPVYQVLGDGAAPVVARRRGEGIIGRAFDLQQPVCVPDYQSWGGATVEALGAGIRSGVAAPLVQGGNTIGIIVARTVDPAAAFDDEDAQLLGLLSSHAAVALTNARLYAEQQEIAAHAARRAAELEAVLESMTDGVLLVDAEGAITSANRAAETILGRDDLVTHAVTLRELTPTLRPAEPDSWDEATSPVDLAALLTSRSGEWELELEQDGQHRRLAVVSSGVGGEEGGTLVVLRDVTDRRQFEERVAQAEKLRALGQLASGVAHGINNLLAAVLGRAELTRTEIEYGHVEPGRIAEALRLIEQAAEDGAHMVRRIQEFARPRLDAESSIVDVAEVVRDVLELTRPRWWEGALAAGAAISVSAELDDGLYVLGSASELREVLTNLVLNAVDAMPDGGDLTIAGRQEGKRVRLDVTDTGVGMSRGVSRRVFEPFFTTKAAGGTGLGLAISHGIIRERGGQMSVRSEVEQGTTFSIDLPYAAPDAVRQPIPVEATHQPSLYGARILVVDDEPALGQLLRRVLESHAYQVTTCTSPAQALVAFETASFDLVVTDFLMNQTTGLELAEQIRARSPSTPVLLTTAWGSDLDLAALPSGIVGVLPKPFRLTEVIEAVGAALSTADRRPTVPFVHDRPEQRPSP